MVVAPPSCSQIHVALAPCVPFLKNLVLQPPILCCMGVRIMKETGKTTEDRVAICKCIKEVLARLILYDPTRFPELDKGCGTDLNYPPISRDFDCKK
ncbi:Bifunctional inhibitor/plant lipid transfer protein/seed storage helical domain-containing protein [Cynara cardunculus var. scolymus]|uniref:Bifunctional inhibitor/plant lipid transfer protein/seed storage helical domain-containing protein n=1 Tax=Cynara cardunculus var. scolymus TaxID=59895 RepID=A0A103XUU9_CYNCS|nr:Bifunctional inhibitor/plant lipid transfer protein/seed storage helical domain-containing protein [Cynara cardunculus var. scolymus]